MPEENGLNTIGLAIFSLCSTKRSALPGTQRKRGPAEFLHIFKRPKKTYRRTGFSHLGTLRHPSTFTQPLSQEGPSFEMEIEDPAKAQC